MKLTNREKYLVSTAVMVTFLVLAAIKMIDIPFDYGIIFAGGYIFGAFLPAIIAYLFARHYKKAIQ